MITHLLVEGKLVSWIKIWHFITIHPIHQSMYFAPSIYHCVATVIHYIHVRVPNTISRSFWVSRAPMDAAANTFLNGPRGVRWSSSYKIHYSDYSGLVLRFTDHRHKHLLWCPIVTSKLTICSNTKPEHAGTILCQCKSELLPTSNLRGQ